MMKKLLVLWIAVGIIVLGGINIVNAIDKDMTDKEIAEAYVLEEHGENYYVEMTDHDDDEYVEFHVMDENGNIKYRTGIDRKYYFNRYNE